MRAKILPTDAQAPAACFAEENARSDASGRCLCSIRTSSSSRVLEEEANHFPAGVGSAWIGVRSPRAAARPRVAGALKDPLLQQRPSRFVALNRANEGHPAC